RTKQLMIMGSAWSLDYPDAENVLQLFYGPNEAPGSNIELQESRVRQALRAERGHAAGPGANRALPSNEPDGDRRLRRHRFTDPADRVSVSQRRDRPARPRGAR